MTLIDRIKILRDRWMPRGKTSYSQCGEDLIVAFLLQDMLQVARPSYLDIGAHDPVYLSNTYLFYRSGCHGVCIEPDPSLHGRMQRVRNGDICLNAGVGVNSETSGNFYIFKEKTLNTFSREESVRLSQSGRCAIERVIQVPLIDVNQVIAEYFDPWPNFVSLDTEGMDLAILKTFAFGRFRPEVFCVETLDFCRQSKSADIGTIMHENGYVAYADTHINTVFVDESALVRRQRAELDFGPPQSRKL